MIDADLKAWLPLAGIRLDGEQTAAVLAEGERALSRYVKTDGTVEFVSLSHIVTAAK